MSRAPISHPRRPASRVPTSRVLLALLVPVLLVSGGCGSSSAGADGGGSAADRVRGSLVTDTRDATIGDAEDAVARRREATPAEIFDVGAPESLDVRPDGSLITSWQASADTEGEGPVQRAWRVVDADGRRLAEGRMSETGSVLAVGDGFLVVGRAEDPPSDVRHVDLEGDVRRVRVVGRPGFPRRGDTLVPDLAAYYRPSSRTLLVSRVAPEVDQAGVAAGRNAALSDTGVLYQYADPPRSPLPLGVTEDGGARWRYTRVDVGRLRPNLVAAHGDDAVIALFPPGSSSRLAGLSITDDAGRSWRRSGALAGLPRDGYVDHLNLGADDRAVTGGYGTGWWRARSGDPTSYAPLPVPRDGVSDVRASRSRLVATSRTAIWSSTDDGETWTRLDVQR